MKTSSLLAASLVCSTVLSATAQAQPILNRIENLVRDQIGAANRQQPNGPAEPGYLGLIGDDAEQPASGVLVIEVYKNQPAARAGLREGDLITKINGQPVRNMDAMAAALKGKTAGTRLSVVVERNGAQQPLEVTLGQRPEAVVPPQNLPADNRAAEVLPEPTPAAAPEQAPRPRLGVRTVPVTEQVQRMNRLPDTDGGQVISVSVGSPAERAGIPLGAVIRAVDGQSVRTPQELAAVISDVRGPTVELTCVIGGQSVQKTVQIGPATTADEGPQLEIRSRPLQANPITAAPRPPAADSDANGSKVEALERRVRELEARIQALEAERTGEKPADAGDES